MNMFSIINIPISVVPVSTCYYTSSSSSSSKTGTGIKGAGTGPLLELF